jgi:methionyl-tRNA formyltransferase
LRLAFFGTPEIARTVLAALIDAGEDDVVMAICQPDKPKGRGKKIEAPPVKALAEERGIQVLQPVKLKDGALARTIREAEIDLAIVVAYGRILPVDLFEAPRFHSWNVHASLLPKHRGASPIQHAILSGDAETGVSLMKVSAGMDEGPVLLERRLPLDGTETGGSLTEKLAELGAKCAVDGIRLAKTEGLSAVPQSDAEATYAPILEKGNGQLDFTRPAAELLRRIRAFDPWPGTFILQKEGPLKVLRAEAAEGRGAPGTVLEAGPDLVIATSDGAVRILAVQPPGKRGMSAGDFLRGAGRNVRIGEPYPGC